MDKNFYNEASAAKLGWDPSWFSEKYFDAYTIEWTELKMLEKND